VITEDNVIQLPTKKPVEGIPATNEIVSFMHCGRCLDEMPDNFSPREWVQLEVGFTPLGIQIWCKRREANVMHMDFQGHKFPANVSAITVSTKE
jgi:hypothetical protein